MFRANSPQVLTECLRRPLDGVPAESQQCKHLNRKCSRIEITVYLLVASDTLVPVLLRNF